MRDCIYELCFGCNEIQPCVCRNYIDRTEWRCRACGALVDVEYIEGDCEDLSTAPNP